ncbi:ftsJ-like methyltransferase domain-containing protein [Ditylenchus destructor]|uniref:Cap-specific mRNA (nucleoside-2'-O-)-methyltransferase 2 n=1 Tax=Ditylenchus destructor TaxID=166010 RepID=A0AAD4N8N5_9BILA|nr:ftsJ-like methyltransferase domain-containing protein [Ditylenchus destructor]
MSVTQEYESLCASIFTKSFVLKSSAYDPCRPSITSYNEMLSALASIETKLNASKLKVNEIVKKHGTNVWRRHTSFMHPLKNLPKRLLALDILPGDIITQAYCKFAEIIATNNLLNRWEPCSDGYFRSLHLCEAPGAFVSLLKRAMTTRKWQWLMNSLNPYHEWNSRQHMLFDDTFIFQHLENMAFGPDDTGNIFTWNEGYLSDMTNENGKFGLITADGSFDCTDDPLAQEIRIHHLIQQEVKIAMKCLSPGGHLILKMYTFFQPQTIEILSEILSHFREVLCQKPSSSKPGNSEVYLVCLFFKDTGSCSTESLTPTLMNKIVECTEYFALHQMEFIEFNLNTFHRLSTTQKTAIEIQKIMAEESVIKEVFPNDVHANLQGKQVVKTMNTPWLAQWIGELGQIQQSNTKCSHYVTHSQGLEDCASINLCSDLDNFLYVSTNRNLTITQLMKQGFIVVRETPTNDQLNKQLITHSLFCNATMFEQHYQEVNDLCQLETSPVPQQSARHINCWQLTKSDWISLLAKETNICREIDNEDSEPLKIILSTNKPTLILSRFSASVIFFLTLIFQEINISRHAIGFKNKKPKFQHESDLTANLLIFLAMLRNVAENPQYDLLQFFPLRYFSYESFYCMITMYNNKMLGMFHIDTKNKS